MAFVCARGCTRNGKPLEFAFLKGWKRHYTNKHTTWTQEELEQVVAQARGTEGAESSEGSFDSFAATLPETEADIPPSSGAAAATPGPTPQTTTVKTDAAAKKLAAKAAKLKREIATALPRAVEQALLRKGPTWAMSKEQKEMLTDSIESVFDVLDVQFQIQQYNVELKSRIWVFLYPVAVLLAILGLIAAKNTDTETEKEKDKSETEAPAFVQ